MFETTPGILRTKCIFHQPSLHDGRRISVMSRHTNNDGITTDARLDNVCDEHRPELGPSPKLIGDYYKRGLSWDAFTERYLDGLTGQLQRESIASIMTLLHEKDVTLMCVEETPERCHRRLLAEAIQMMGFGGRVDVR